MDPNLLLGSLLFASAAAATWLAAGRIADRLLPSGRWVERVLRRALVAALIAILGCGILGGAGLLGRWGLVAWTAAASVVAHAMRREPSAAARLRLGGHRWRVLWPFAPALLLLAVDAAMTLPVPPTNWDAMTYHLYLPARWLQEGRIFHVPTVFSDESAAYAPQNGALLHAWQMALLGRDATTNVYQVALTAMLALAVFRLTLLLGGRPRTAAMAGATSVVMPPLRHWAMSANVDVTMTAFFVVALEAALAFALRRERGSVAVAGLAAGLALGTKTVGLPLVGLLSLGLGAVLVARRSWRGLGILGGGLVVAGGFWHLRNLVFYRNPLFPLEVGFFGIPIFRGVYDLDALQQSLFRVPRLSDWLLTMERSLGAAPCLLALLGVIGLCATPRRGGPRRRLAAVLLGAFASFWAVYVYAGIAHNNQARFLAPALVVAVAGWARWIDLPRAAWARSALFATGFLGLLLASRPERFWAATGARLEAAGVDLGRWLAVVVGSIVASALAVHLGRRRLDRRGIAARTLAPVLATVVLLVGAANADQARPAFYAATDFRAWGAGYLPWNDPAMAPRRIAASGLNVPYASMGVGWRHRVVYCNTRGGPDDGLYEHWLRAGRPRSASHKPGLYRGADDSYPVWRACLDRQGIDTVVLFQTLPLERPESWPLSDGFPIERDWVRARPAEFEPLILTERAEIHAVLRPPVAEVAETLGEPLRRRPP